MLDKIRNHGSRLILNKLPKWPIPIVVILLVALIFFVAEYASSLVLSFYALFQGWTVSRANNWLQSSITAQFFYVLLAEVFTVGLVVLILRKFKLALVDIGLKKPRFVDGGLALIAYPAYLILYIGLLAIVTHFFPQLNVNQSQQIGFNSVHGTYQLVLTFISLVILPPFAEEVLFRGFLFEGLKKGMPVIYAAALTCLLFASAHLPEGGSSGPFWVGALDIFVLSVALVYLKQKTKSLWPGIFLHSLNNLIAFVTLFLLTGR